MTTYIVTGQVFVHVNFVLISAEVLTNSQDFTLAIFKLYGNTYCIKDHKGCLSNVVSLEKIKYNRMIDGRQIFKPLVYARGTLAPFLRLDEVGRVCALKRVPKQARNVAVLVTKRILIHTVEPPLTAIFPQPPPLYKGHYFWWTFHTLTLV